MKKCYLLLAAFIFSLSFTAKASHIEGMDIRYAYTGTGNVYRVYLDVYSQCINGGTSLYTSEGISFQSASCGYNFLRSFNKTSEDTLRYMYCSSVLVTCGGTYSPFLVAHYIDTVTLAPCTNWKISCTDGSRNGAIINLAGASSANIYVEAFLDNSAAPNSSPIIDGYPQFFGYIGQVVTAPFHVSDIEGDSVTGTMLQPQNTNGAPIGYSVGYTMSQPFGGGTFTQLSVPNSYLKFIGNSMGKYSVAARVSDYRNGTLVGYSSRDWTQLFTNGTDPKDPMPAPGTSFNASTCPGQSHSLTLSFVDSVATDSVSMLLTPPSNGITFTTTYAPGIGSGSATISWTTPTTYNVTANKYFIIKVFAHDQHCINGNATYNLIVHAGQCITDSVWAGDANDDYVVDMYDPLAIAQAYGSTGPLRTGASLAWTPQWCANWTNSFINGINYKHSDCDGNGTVNSSDLTAITTNYSLTHTRGEDQPYAKGAGNPDLYFDNTGINAAPGSTVTIPLKLGSSAFPMNNIYGLAGRIRITGITPGAPAVTYPASWLGTTANTLHFAKSTNANTLDMAYARTDHQNTSGQGALAALSFGIPAGTNGQKVVLSMEGIKMIAANGTVLTAYNVLNDTLTIHSLGLADIASPVSAAVITPNPSGAVASLMLNMTAATNVEVMVTDVAGRGVWQSGPFAAAAGVQEVILPKTLQSGLYLVRIKAGGATQVMKWLRD